MIGKSSKVEVAVKLSVLSGWSVRVHREEGGGCLCLQDVVPGSFM